MFVQFSRIRDSPFVPLTARSNVPVSVSVGTRCAVNALASLLLWYIRRDVERSCPSMVHGPGNCAEFVLDELLALKDEHAAVARVRIRLASGEARRGEARRGEARRGEHVIPGAVKSRKKLIRFERSDETAEM